MNKFFIILTATLICLFSLASCSREEAPDGLQVVAISEEDGIKFYGPEGWTVINDSYNADYKVYATKLTGRSKTSLTFVGAPMPEGDIAAYFTSSLTEVPESIMSTLTVTKPVEPDSFGNADEAYKCIYTYKYTEYDYTAQDYVQKDMTCMQIFIKNDGEFYIFTYTAYGTPTDGEGDYLKYLETVQSCITSFEFTAKSGMAGDVIYEKDADGYNLVSDKSLCGFELYLPDSYKVAGNTGDIEAKISDGASLSLTRASDTGVNIITYLGMRKSELSQIVTEITDIQVTVTTEYNAESEIFNEWEIDVMPVVDSSLRLGDLSNIAAYEYTYVYDGEKYHVYQVLGVDFTTGYVFTYTAAEDEYAEHIDTIKTILKKVRF